MSIKAMTAVWDRSKQKGSALLLLLAIADHAHDDGAGAWPSVETLAGKTRMTERNVQFLLRKLEDSQELETDVGGGPHGTNAYRIRFDKMRDENFSGVKGSVKGGERQRKKGVKATSPKPSLEPSSEPLKIADASAPPPRFRVGDVVRDMCDGVQGRVLSVAWLYENWVYRYGHPEEVTWMSDENLLELVPPTDDPASVDIGFTHAEGVEEWASEFDKVTPKTPPVKAKAVTEAPPHSARPPKAAQSTGAQTRQREVGKHPAL